MQPLAWPREWVHPTAVQRFLVGMPFIGIERRAYRHVCDHLLARGPEYRATWNAVAVSESAWSYCSRAIKAARLWPSERFIPDDPFAIVLSDIRGDGFPVIELLWDFADHFGIKRDRLAWETYQERTYGSFLEHLSGGAV